MEERRSIPRYLCSDNFSDSIVEMGGETYQLISTNFNRHGIALYTNQRLPEGDKCKISFSFDHLESKVEIDNLSCAIRHRHETEVGHQYGIQFETEPGEDNKVYNLLVIIEEFLSAAASEDRYGLE